MRKSGVTRPDIEPGSPWWEASRLTAQKPLWRTQCVGQTFTPAGPAILQKGETFPALTLEAAWSVDAQLVAQLLLALVYVCEQRNTKPRDGIPLTPSTSVSARLALTLRNTEAECSALVQSFGHLPSDLKIDDIWRDEGRSISQFAGERIYEPVSQKGPVKPGGQAQVPGLMHEPPLLQLTAQIAGTSHVLMSRHASGEHHSLPEHKLGGTLKCSSGVAVRLLASHLGDPCSIPRGTAFGFLHERTVPDDATAFNMKFLRADECEVGESGATPECTGERNRRPQRKPVDKGHRQAQFPHTKIRELPCQVSNLVHLGGRQVVRPLNHRDSSETKAMM
ncbi:hypothetical protein PR048_010475 [Dryococelus australis]|uniref:Uncharacterized protein n=1 Tax=Dryococelus australis TaxID=614101 RepID=A0ABQ9I2V8_9NEOP|nr:hypothetical protein PR048_010475 [Dryococelus australis]